MINSILRSARELTCQLTGKLRRAGDKQPVVLEWDKLPLIPLAGREIPRDLTKYIFSYLDPENLFKVRMVCRLWHQIASPSLLLPRLFPQAPLVDAQVWGEFVDLEKHKLVFGTVREPNITKKDYIEIKKIASQVEPNPHIYPIGFIDLPEGLTPNKLIAMGKSPKKGNKVLFGYIDPEVHKQYGGAGIKQTVRILVTNGIFKSSRNKNKDDHFKLVKDLKCDMPEVIPFMANIVLTCIRSNSDNPLRLFGDDLGSNTRCVEYRGGSIGGVYMMLYMGFANQPLFPHTSDLSASYDLDYISQINHFGVGGMRKFPTIGN